MSNIVPPKRIAYISAAAVPTAQPEMEGILRYHEDHPGFAFRDFRFQELPAPHAPPPWGDWLPDGVIASIGSNPGVPEWLSQHRRLPLVCLGAEWAGHWPCVFTAPAALAALAREHFLDLGFTHFAFISAADDPACELRRQAFAKSLVSKGHHLLLYELENDPVSGIFSAESAAAAEPGLITLLRSAPKPLAVFVPGETIGRAVCMACQHLQLAVPHEVAVLCVGNTMLARTCEPPLSAIQTPAEDIGYQGMALLDRLLRKQMRRTAPRLEIPATRLVVRQSTSTARESTDAATHLRQLIAQQACQGVSLDQIIAVLDVSRSTVERQFLAAFGVTPGQELLRVRLERAKELLLTRMPVKQVAAAVGYTRASSFNDFFRHQTGLTPLAFRQSAFI